MKEVTKEERPAMQPRPRRGRRTKYTPEVAARICEAVADGLPYKFAAALGGVSHETLCQWQRRFPEFAEAIQGAVAKGVLERLRLIKAAAEKGDVKAAQWWLEHVFPENFARNRIEHEHTGRIGHELVITPDTLTAIAESRKRYELAHATN